MKARFIQGDNPYKTLNIGNFDIVNNITQNNLTHLDWFYHYIIKGTGFSFTEEELKELNSLYNFLKNKIQFGKKFHWTEEKDMVLYIEDNANGRYVYDSSNSNDYWNVLFSTIKFPKIDTIDTIDTIG